MSFKKDSFIRCYVEAWAFWLSGNILIDWVEYLGAKIGRELAPRPFGFVEKLSDPFFLISNALLVALLAAMLIGHRRPTGASD